MILSSGAGKIVVNGRDYKQYFGRKAVAAIMIQSLDIADMLDKVDVKINVSGGGLSGQAGAIRHAIANALRVQDPSLSPVLRSKGYLTRDDRKVQRKMYGHKKARKSFQFSKR